MKWREADTVLSLTQHRQSVLFARLAEETAKALAISNLSKCSFSALLLTTGTAQSFTHRQSIVSDTSKCCHSDLSDSPLLQA